MRDGNGGGNGIEKEGTETRRVFVRNCTEDNWKMECTFSMHFRKKRGKRMVIGIDGRIQRGGRSD